MAIYHIEGIDHAGKRISGEVEAGDVIALKEELRKKQIFLESFKEKKEKRRSDFLAVSSKPSPQEFITFCQEFAILLEAGASISESLDTLRKQKFGTVFKNAISSVYEAVLKGTSLGEAFRAKKKIFPPFFCSMVEVGEVSSTLPQTLKKAAAYYDNANKTRQETRSALVYPLFLAAVVIAVIVLLMNLVIPQFKQTFSQLGAKLPGVTLGVIAVSDFFVKDWMYLLIALVSLALILYLLTLTKQGKYLKELLLWNLPLVRGVKRSTTVSMFCDSFAIMLSSGLPVLECMKNIPTIIGNEYFNRKFMAAIAEVDDGRTLSRALQNTMLFPPTLIEMVQVGEKSSDLSHVFESVCDYYEERRKNATKRMTSIIEPALIIVMAGVVLLIMLSVFLPLYGIYDQLDHIG